MSQFEDLEKTSLGVGLAASAAPSLDVGAGLEHFAATDLSLNVSAVSVPAGEILWDFMGLGLLAAVTSAALKKVFEADAK